MSTRNPHRVNWIGRIDVKGHWCRACWTFAPTVKAMQAHADAHEPSMFDVTRIPVVEAS